MNVCSNKLFNLLWLHSCLCSVNLGGKVTNRNICSNKGFKTSLLTVSFWNMERFYQKHGHSKSRAQKKSQNLPATYCVINSMVQMTSSAREECIMHRCIQLSKSLTKRSFSTKHCPLRSQVICPGLNSHSQHNTNFNTHEMFPTFQELNGKEHNATSCKNATPIWFLPNLQEE